MSAAEQTAKRQKQTAKRLKELWRDAYFSNLQFTAAFLEAKFNNHDARKRFLQKRLRSGVARGSDINFILAMHEIAKREFYG
jgi:hypothetical protein